MISFLFLVTKEVSGSSYILSTNFNAFKFYASLWRFNRYDLSNKAERGHFSWLRTNGKYTRIPDRKVKAFETRYTFIAFQFFYLKSQTTCVIYAVCVSWPHHRIFDTNDKWTRLIISRRNGETKVKYIEWMKLNPSNKLFNVIIGTDSKLFSTVSLFFTFNHSFSSFFVQFVFHFCKREKNSQ